MSTIIDGNAQQAEQLSSDFEQTVQKYLQMQTELDGLYASKDVAGLAAMIGPLNELAEHFDRLEKWSTRVNTESFDELNRLEKVVRNTEKISQPAFLRSIDYARWTRDKVSVAEMYRDEGFRGAYGALPYSMRPLPSQLRRLASGF